MTEREIHYDFKKWLREHRIPFVESRMDRKSTIAKAWPDFTVCFMSRVVLIEVKSQIGRLRPDQVKMIEYIKRSGNKVEIARSVRECVEAVKSILCEGKRCTEPAGGCNYPLEECFKELKRAVAAVPVNGTKVLSGGAESGVSSSDPIITGPKDGGHRSASQSFFIGDWQGNAYVFAPDQGGAYRMIRKASVFDVANLPRLPS